jgi:hypothetical protein
MTQGERAPDFDRAYLNRISGSHEEQLDGHYAVHPVQQGLRAVPRKLKSAGKRSGVKRNWLSLKRLPSYNPQNMSRDGVTMG